MKYLFILTFFLVFIISPPVGDLGGFGLGFTAALSLWRHITYNFAHANAFHLILNSFSFYCFFRILERFIARWKLALFIIAVGFLASFFVHYSKVTVGASAMVYAMLGIYIALLANRRIRYKTKKQYIIYFVCIAFSFVWSFFIPNSAFALHLISMIIAFGVYYFILFFTSYKSFLTY